jgi:hypothetical protein
MTDPNNYSGQQPDYQQNTSQGQNQPNYQNQQNQYGQPDTPIHAEPLRAAASGARPVQRPLQRAELRPELRAAESAAVHSDRWIRPATRLRLRSSGGLVEIQNRSRSAGHFPRCLRRTQLLPRPDGEGRRSAADHTAELRLPLRGLRHLGSYRGHHDSGIPSGQSMASGRSGV